ncbi:Hypothetical predicted protein [Octopus vulgaris]|uniref:Uncharacterized protein n=1 Tax=Octopus vulgaris TaxID=6645 RepID=A0AA36F372_OCTVU|nr:Hypothetical predicted protein [Octopus vulgaris]
MRISDEDRARLVDAFEGNQKDYLKLTDTPGIKRSSVRSIVETYLLSGRRHKLPRGDAHHVKVDEEIRARHQLINDANSLTTLQQMKKDLEAALSRKPPASVSAISRALDGMLITMKLAEDIPDARHAPRTPEKR